MTPTETYPGTIVPPSADRAIRVAFCVVSLIFSYFAVRLALSIGGFGAIFADMLGGRPLPHLTQFVLRTAPMWVGASLVFAVLPFAAAFFVRRTSHSIYGIAAATAFQVFQALILWRALSGPLVAIIHGMSGGQ